MVHAVVLATLCGISALGAQKPPSPELLQTYATAARAAGRSPEANLKLALWCERNGLEPEREKHLAMVIVADPNNAVARGLLGQVHEDGKWRKPSAIADLIQHDPDRVALLSDYAVHRDKTPKTADAQWKLGLWCEKNGLKSEASAHFVSVIHLEPNNEAARKRLGYKKHVGRWVTSTQLAQERDEAETQRRADKHWLSTLESLQRTLKNSKTSETAERSLASITDPLAVPAMLRVFGKDPDRLVQLLGQTDGLRASRALAWISVFADSGETRRAATETLRRRDPREFVGILISWVRDPMKYRVEEPSRPGQSATLHIEGVKADMRRVYRPTTAPRVPFLPGDTLTVDQYGLPVISRVLQEEWMPRSNWQTIPDLKAFQMQPLGKLQATFASSNGRTAESPGASPLGKVTQPFLDVAETAFANQWAWIGTQTQVSNGVMLWSNNLVYRTESLIVERENIPIGQMVAAADLANQRLKGKVAQDVAAIESVNSVIDAGNRRLMPVLEATTGQSFGPDHHAWENWWSDAQGYAQSQAPEKPEFIEEVAAATPQIMPELSLTSAGIRIAQHSCFGRGTTIRTFTGDSRIELLKVGDLVLSSDTHTGTLSYQPIVAIHHNPPTETLRIDIGTEAIVATGIHRLWMAGKGWVMARELKPGDVLRTVDGTAVVQSISAEKVQPVFNLEVAEGHDFFVGNSGVLAHDNSLIRPVSDPFDALADSVASTRP